MKRLVWFVDVDGTGLPETAGLTLGFEKAEDIVDLDCRRKFVSIVLFQNFASLVWLAVRMVWVLPSRDFLIVLVDIGRSISIYRYNHGIRLVQNPSLSSIASPFIRVHLVVGASRISRTSRASRYSSRRRTSNSIPCRIANRTDEEKGIIAYLDPSRSE